LKIHPPDPEEAPWRKTINFLPGIQSIVIGASLTIPILADAPMGDRSPLK
jgi:hypothetical protein